MLFLPNTMIALSTTFIIGDKFGSDDRVKPIVNDLFLGKCSQSSCFIDFF